MEARQLLTILLAVLLIGSTTGLEIAYAASDIFFAINDTVVKQGPGAGGLQIGGTYTVGAITITISPFGGTPVIDYDETSDWLRMKYAEITTSTPPVDNVKISFWRTFDDLRTGTVTYSISGSGQFSRSTSAGDPNDWISARGYVGATVLGSVSPDNFSSPPPNPPDCTKKLSACATYSPSTWSFNLNAPNTGFKVTHNFGSGGVPQLANGTVDLKGEFWFHLEKSTDRLDISASPGMRVKYGPPGGDGRDGGCDEETSCPVGTRCKCVKLPPVIQKVPPKKP